MERIKRLLNRIGDLFKELDYDIKNINGNTYYFKSNTYYRVTYLNKVNSLVIEYAENYNEVVKNLFVDADIYSLDNGEDNFLNKLRVDLIKYYN